MSGQLLNGIDFYNKIDTFYTVTMYFPFKLFCIPFITFHVYIMYKNLQPKMFYIYNIYVT